jgi:hypothetical protein
VPSIVIFEATRRKYGNTVQSEEDSRAGAQEMCASRGRVVIAQHQYAPFTQSLFQVDGDGSPMTALEPGSDIQRAHCACIPVGGSEANVDFDLSAATVMAYSFGAF